MDTVPAMRRLDERGPASRGLTIDVEGAQLGPRCVLVRRTAGGYRCADRAQVGALVTAFGGGEHDGEAIFTALCRITKALTDGETAFAQIIGLRSSLTALGGDELRRASRVADLIKANFNPDEPRVPAGSPEGGQWSSGDGNDSAAASAGPIGGHEGAGGAGATPAPAGDGNTAGATGSEAHLIEAGYVLSSEMWRTARDLYRLFTAPGSDIAALRDYLAERGLNLNELPDAVRSLFDSPKPLQELQSAKPPMGFYTEQELRTYLGPPRPGYEWHHLIEQNGQFRPDLTSPEGIRSWIQNTENMVMVPAIKHYCISGFMSTTDNGVRFRDVVRAHSPPAQRAVGIALLGLCRVIP